jgi:hypothetical protein
MQAKQQRSEHLILVNLIMLHVLPELGFLTALDIIQDTLKNGHFSEDRTPLSHHRLHLVVI